MIRMFQLNMNIQHTMLLKNMKKKRMEITEHSVWISDLLIELKIYSFNTKLFEGIGIYHEFPFNIVCDAIKAEQKKE